MNPFDFHPPARIVFGAGRIDDLGDLARELGARRVLVVSDPGIIAAGHAQHGVDVLEKSNLEVHLFEGVHQNPTTADVEDGLVFAQTVEPDLIVGLGGGSSMDCAKGINFLFSCGGKMQDYWGVGKATHPLVPMIAVPTTAGTGSETQSFALISDAETHVKMACGDRRAGFRIALLDPKLTVTQPTAVTALTGIDAVAHALETYVTNRRNAVSQAFSCEAWELLCANFARVLEAPDDLDARGGMQLGACFAGLAIENSMLGAAHALANPLTANFGTSHGQAVAVMLPHVIRFNAAEVDSCYRELLGVAQGVGDCPTPDRGGDGLADFVQHLVRQAGLHDHLGALGVPEEQLPQLAAQAAEQWTATFNPRKVNQDDLHKLYRAAY